MHFAVMSKAMIAVSLIKEGAHLIIKSASAGAGFVVLDQTKRELSSLQQNSL